jgi:hypothetical protein
MDGRMDGRTDMVKPVYPSTTIGSGYYISVSSNGQDFTEELTTIVYDSTCYACHLASLTCDELVICIYLSLLAV